MISVFPRMTDTPRLSIARGVILRDASLIASAIPGAFLCAISIVASGVQSLGENPVPPVVKIISILFSSHNSQRHFFISSFSSGNNIVSCTSYPLSVSISQIRGPLLSSLSPAYPLSLNVTTAAFHLYSAIISSPSAQSIFNSLFPSGSFTL